MPKVGGTEDEEHARYGSFVEHNLSLGLHITIYREEWNMPKQARRELWQLMPPKLLQCSTTNCQNNKSVDSVLPVNNIYKYTYPQPLPKLWSIRLSNEHLSTMKLAKLALVHTQRQRDIQMSKRLFR